MFQKHEDKDKYEKLGVLLHPRRLRQKSVCLQKPDTISHSVTTCFTDIQQSKHNSHAKGNSV